MATAILLTGPSGSGKTTIRAAIQKRFPDAVVASSDDHLMERAKAEGISYQAAYALYANEAKRIYNESIQGAIRSGSDIIVDRTMLTSDLRAALVRGLSQKYDIIAAKPDFDVRSAEGTKPDFDVRSAEGTMLLLERAQSRTDRGEPMSVDVVMAQIEAYEEPSIDEGFALVCDLKDSLTAIERFKTYDAGPGNGI